MTVAAGTCHSSSCEATDRCTFTSWQPSEAGGTGTDTSVVSFIDPADDGRASFEGWLLLAAVAVRDPAGWHLMAAGLAT